MSRYTVAADVVLANASANTITARFAVVDTATATAVYIGQSHRCEEQAAAFNSGATRPFPGYPIAIPAAA